MESTGEDSVTIVEMTTEDLEYYINLPDKAESGLRGLAPILKEVLPWVKCYQTALHKTEKSFVKGRVHPWGKFHCRLILRNCRSQPAFRHHQPDQPAAVSIEARPSTSKTDYDSLKAQMMLSIF